MAKTKAEKTVKEKNVKAKTTKTSKAEKTTKVKKTKVIKKSFVDTGMHWETSKIVLRLMIDENESKDYLRTFMSGSSIYINKDKIGKKTKYDNDKWGVITDIKEDEKDLVFILEPVTV